MNMTTKFCFFCNQKTAYEMRISDWSSDVCSSDLVIDAYRSPGTAPNVEHLFPSPPATAMARWASDRLEAVGTNGSAIFTILRADVVEVLLERTTGIKEIGRAHV